MLVVTPEEVSKFRNQLADYPAALTALHEIEECEGSLEDAVTVLAIESGQEPDRAPQWFNDLLERSRQILCQEDVRDEIMAGFLAVGVEALLASTIVPAGLAAPVVIYVFKVGIKKYCQISPE